MHSGIHATAGSLFCPANPQLNKTPCSLLYKNARKSINSRNSLSDSILNIINKTTEEDKREINLLLHYYQGCRNGVAHMQSPVHNIKFEANGIEC